MGAAGGRGGSSLPFRAREDSMRLRIALTLSVMIAFGCERPTAPTTGTGGVTLGIFAASANGASPLDSVRILVRGPTNRTVAAAPGTTVTIDRLAPGAY